MFKDILVCLNSYNTMDNTVEVAAKLAVQHQARLTGLFIKNDLVNRYYTYEYIPIEVIDTVIEEEKKRSEEAKDNFLKITKRFECKTDWHSILESQNSFNTMFYTDLICIGHDKNTSHNLFNSSVFVNHILLETGRPLLLIPTSWNEDKIGRNVLLAWNESRESVRAMHEALPIMQTADKVDVVSVTRKIDSKADRLAEGIEVSHYLTRRDITCQLHSVETKGLLTHVEQAILEKAEELHSDLIVMGGYGHSQMRELLLGGVTRNLCNNSDIPLFLVH